MTEDELGQAMLADAIRGRVRDNAPIGSTDQYGPVILAAMKPGKEYTSGDIQTLTGVPVNTAGKVLGVLHSRGLVEKGRVFLGGNPLNTWRLA